jgi:hypothetical protein
VLITCPRIRTEGFNLQEYTEAACMMITIIMQQQGLVEAKAIDYLREHHPTIKVYKDSLDSWDGPLDEEV